MKKYVSPEAIKVNFEVNDIITASGMLLSSGWNGWTDDALENMTVSWNQFFS